MKYFIIFAILFSPLTIGKSKKIKYKYKKYEKFDFEVMNVSGSNSSPGDLSIGPRFKKKFKNKIPERKNFNKEMRKAVNSIL